MAATCSSLAGNFYSGITPATVPWPGGTVPYAFDSSVNATQQQTYLDGLREWELAAGVKFVPHTNQANWILFSYNTNFLDYVQGGSYSPQIVTVASLSRAQVCHEMGHSFGFTHENIRPDATNFVLVLTNNISDEPSNIYWFTIDSTSVTNGNYDYESVMHLGWDFDSTNPGVLATQQPRPPNFPKYQYRMGNYCLSPGDRAALAYLYGPPLTPLSNIVTNTADVGPGSLRAALYYVTDHSGSIVTFNIPVSDPGYSNGVFNIHLTGMLPPLVSNGMVIDGSTQPGYAGKPLIIIDGSQILPETAPSYASDTGLLVYSSSNQVKNVSFSGFIWNGLTFEYPYATNNTVSGCWLGIDSTGTNPAPNAFQGILATSGSSHNTFGPGNVISGNGQYGIFISGTNTTGTIVKGNFIGTDPSGKISVSNALSGVFIGGSTSNNTIGGTNAAARNILSGNGQYGIWLSDTNTVENLVEGNYLGTDVTGSNAVPNQSSGILVGGGTSSNTIGGTNAAARNILSGNGQYGIWLSNTNTVENLVEGNYIGTDATGSNAVPNQSSGMLIGNGASSNIIGGASAGARNILSGNLGYGIFMTNASYNVISGNYLGVNASGETALGNTMSGIGMFGLVESNYLGTGNVISGNPQYGIEIGGPTSANNFIFGNYIGIDAAGTNAIGTQSTGVGIVDSAEGNVIGPGNVISGNNGTGIHFTQTGTSNNVVIGNLIGTDKTGTYAIPNTNFGVFIDTGPNNNTVGGTTAPTRNIISGTTGYGYGIAVAAANNNVVEGNYIGTDITGTNNLQNGYAGVAVESGSVGNLIGGTAPGAGNVIAFNGEGVAVFEADTTNDAIRGNSIFDNYYQGIYLDSFTNNHPGFIPAANDWQNYPVVTNAFGYGGSTIIKGILSSLNSQNYFIDFFYNNAQGPGGYGEGQVYLGSATVTTGPTGNAFFSYTNTSGNYSGQYISATATATNGDTSEFGPDVLATNLPAPSAQFTGPFRWLANGFVFNLSFTTNFSYHIQATTNLAPNAIQWVNLTNFTATSASLIFTDRTATSYRARFYRVVSP